MLDLAMHIISTKKGEFIPATFDDRYEAALAELVKAKMEGRSLPKREKVEVSKPPDLLKALRESAGLMKAAASDEKPKRTAADANQGSVRKAAARRVASKAASSKAAPQRKAG